MYRDNKVQFRNCFYSWLDSLLISLFSCIFSDICGNLLWLAITRYKMPIQAPQWTEFLSCPVCYNVFNEHLHRPISLACGHTVCKTCLSKLQQRKCPFDQSLITRDIDDLPANFALLQLVSATATPDNKKLCVPTEYKQYYERAKACVEELALLLKPVSSSE